MRSIVVLARRSLIWLLLLFIATTGNTLYEKMSPTDTAFIIPYVLVGILILFAAICITTLFVNNTFQYVYCFAFPCMVDTLSALLVGLMGYFHIPSEIPLSYIYIVITLCTFCIVRTRPHGDEDVSQCKPKVSRNNTRYTPSEMKHD